MRRSARALRDRKSTRLNSSHANISYAVFCLKKKTRQEVRALHTPRAVQEIDPRQRRHHRQLLPTENDQRPVAHPLLPLFFFNDTATTEIYTLSLHDALPISTGTGFRVAGHEPGQQLRHLGIGGDRKSTRLNSSHANSSYAVFCSKKKNR